jgi:rod shape-determining protein MreD
MEVLPGLSVLILAVLAVLPWGGSDSVRFAIAMLPMMAIQYWATRRPQMMPISLVFAAGLLLDVLTHGPLGFWALLALAASALGRSDGALSSRSTALGRAVGYAFAMFALAGLAWVIASVYFNRLVDWRPMVNGAAFTVLLYPLLALLMMPVDRAWDAPRSRFFVRGQ